MSTSRDNLPANGVNSRPDGLSPGQSAAGRGEGTKANCYKIGLIGEEGDIMAFRALGLDLFPVKEPAEVGGILAGLIKSKEYGIILITEAVGEAARSIVEEASSRPLPSLAFIPGSQGSRGFARERLRKIIERAVGVDILSGKEGR